MVGFLDEEQFDLWEKQKGGRGEIKEESADASADDESEVVAMMHLGMAETMEGKV